MKKETVNEFKSTLRIFFYSLLVLYFFTGYVGTVYKIEGSSMNPLLLYGDRVVSSRLAYKTSDIKRGDVAVFYSPTEPQKYYIKRIIGLPGETIQIRNGTIFIDNQQLTDLYTPDEFRTSENLNPTLIPLGHYFVVGDHRNVSNDSRAWTRQPGFWPFVPERYIQGKICFRIWPLNRISCLSPQNSQSMLID